MGLFQAGQRLTAALLNSVLPVNVATVTDQTINASGGTNAITGLSWAVQALSYGLSGTLFCVQGASTAQQAFGINGPTASLVAIGVNTIDTTPSTGVVDWGAFELTSIPQRGSLGQTGNITDTHTFKVDFSGQVTFTAAGTLTLCASCITSTSDTWTVKAGSFAQLIQIQ